MIWGWSALKIAQFPGVNLKLGANLSEYPKRVFESRTVPIWRYRSENYSYTIDESKRIAYVLLRTIRKLKWFVVKLILYDATDIGKEKLATESSGKIPPCGSSNLG